MKWVLKSWQSNYCAKLFSPLHSTEDCSSHISINLCCDAIAFEKKFIRKIFFSKAFHLNHRLKLFLMILLIVENCKSSVEKAVCAKIAKSCVENQGNTFRRSKTPNSISSDNQDWRFPMTINMGLRSFSHKFRLLHQRRAINMCAERVPKHQNNSINLWFSQSSDMFRVG